MHRNKLIWLIILVLIKLNYLDLYAIDNNTLGAFIINNTSDNDIYVVCQITTISSPSHSFTTNGPNCNISNNNNNNPAFYKKIPNKQSYSFSINTKYKNNLITGYRLGFYKTKPNCYDKNGGTTNCYFYTSFEPPGNIYTPNPSAHSPTGVEGGFTANMTSYNISIINADYNTANNNGYSVPLYVYCANNIANAPLWICQNPGSSDNCGYIKSKITGKSACRCHYKPNKNTSTYCQGQDLTNCVMAYTNNNHTNSNINTLLSSQCSGALSITILPQ